SASSTTPPTPTPTTTVEFAPRLSATAKGKQPSRATTPIESTYVQRTEAKQLKIVLKRSRQETHISQQSGSAGAGKDDDDDDDEDNDDNDEEEEFLRVMKRIQRLVRVAMKLEKVKVKVMKK
nr:hypothetical protein [Tanacetum cinerariifolium]